MIIINNFWYIMNGYYVELARPRNILYIYTFKQLFFEILSDTKKLAIHLSYSRVKWCTRIVIVYGRLSWEQTAVIDILAVICCDVEFWWLTLTQTCVHLAIRRNVDFWVSRRFVVAAEAEETRRNNLTVLRKIVKHPVESFFFVELTLRRDLNNSHRGRSIQ